MKRTILALFLLASVAPGNAIGQCTDPPVQPGAIVGIDPACPGATTQYYILPVPDATSYVWTLPNGWTGSSTTTDITVVVGNTGGAITVAAVNNCGISTAQVYTATTFNATTIPNGTVDVCDGPVLLTANSGQGYQYQWFDGGTPITGATNITYNATTSGSYTVQVASNNCMNVSAPVVVNITEMPVVTASTSGSGCVGIQLDLQGTSSATGVTYSWSGPNNFSNAQQNPSIASASVSDAGTYTLTVTDGPCVAIATTDVEIYQGAPSTPSLISGPLEMCELQSGNIFQVTDDPNAALYNWSIPNDWSGSSTTHILHSSAGFAGSLIVSVTAENGCGVSAPSILNVTVNPTPLPVIVQSGNTLTVSQTFASYQWYTGITNIIAGATSQSYTPAQPGSYTVVVTSNEGCVGQSVLTTFTTGVPVVSNGRSIILYPSPNTGSFTVEGAFAANDGKANIMIVDVAGRVVYQQQATVVNGKISARVNMSSALAAGVYTMKISSEAANAVIPFVKK